MTRRKLLTAWSCALGAAAIIIIAVVFWSHKQISKSEFDTELARQEILKLRTAHVERETQQPQIATGSPSPIIHAPSQAASLRPTLASDETKKRIEHLRVKYAAFARARHLGASQLEQLLQLELKQEQTSADFQELIKQNNLAADSAAATKVRNDLEKPISQGLKALLGTAGIESLIEYDQTYIYRESFVDPFDESLASLNSPLTGEQQDEIASLLSVNDRPSKMADRTSTFQVNIDWDQLVTQVQSENILSPAQLQQLKDFADRYRKHG